MAPRSLVLELIRSLRCAEEELAAREADVKTLATALSDIVRCRTEDETSAVVAEVLPYFTEWVRAPRRGSGRTRQRWRSGGSGRRGYDTIQRSRTPCRGCPAGSAGDRDAPAIPIEGR
jgi:hypothetical protein